ncbi:MAG: amidohydrolase family protein, partial [Phycisphaeraceae bacterium]
RTATTGRGFMMIIDAHQHFWQRSQPFNYEWLKTPAHTPINRDYLPDDLKPHLDRAGVRRSIFVQTQHDIAENRWVLELAETNDFIAGVVGWVDLASPACEEQLLQFADHPKFVGIRHVTQDEPDDDFIIRPDIMRGLRVLEKHRVPFDLLFYVKHLKHAATLGAALPELPMVIDHLAKPRIKEGVTKGWVDDLRAAAKFPNIYCKLSGLITESDWKAWKPADLKPYVQAALDAFGPGRCMFGSDWPVCELAGSYEQVFAALVEALGPIGEHERAAVFGGTAATFYGLK